MKNYIKIVSFVFISLCAFTSFAAEKTAPKISESITTFRDAADFGFAPENAPEANVKALQKAVNGGGTITVSKAGVYKMNDTVFLDDNTRLIFGAGVVVQKINNPKKSYTYVFTNRGIFEKKWNKDIWLEGLTLSVNGVDRASGAILGLRSHISFFYVKDLKITRFRCYDLAKAQFCIQVCTFENLLIDDVIIHGMKDGVHLGRGKHFKISNCVFKTFDDAIALNAHDYDSSNPELGWIEDGVVENCVDLNDVNTTGYFCRILAGSWKDWEKGMSLQKSDTVVANGRLYRVSANPDGKIYTSNTCPDFAKGRKVIDGITWFAVQDDVTYNAGVRNVVFRDIFLYKPRVAFSVHFDNDKYSRSYYPEAPFVGQENLVFDNIHILHDAQRNFISTRTPINTMVIKNCFLRNNPIHIGGLNTLKDTTRTSIKMFACSINATKPLSFVNCPNKAKPVDFTSFATTITNPKFKIKTSISCPESKINCDWLKDNASK